MPSSTRHVKPGKRRRSGAAVFATPDKARRIVRRLAKHYPDAQCALEHRSPLELLVATILSAQCTDKRVNIVTRDLFRKYRTARDYAQSPPGELERDIQSTGFYNAKARSLRACCRELAERYGGDVPRDLEALVAMPGIGRKTANVVLGTAYGLATGVVVDTHVGRIARRLGLTAERDAEKVERDLMRLIPKRQWVDFSHRLIHHGRQICVARNPKCDVCPLDDLCPKIGVEKS